jgi:hypothetical protein
MAQKPLKAKLYDKPRYPFDEEQLFHHFDSDKERAASESSTFPWFKAIWLYDRNTWSLQRSDGKFFNFWDFDVHNFGGMFPEYRMNLSDVTRYGGTPVFFIHWMKAVTYDRSIVLWNKTAKAILESEPEKKPDQVAKLCDQTVAKWFESLKDCITEERP